MLLTATHATQTHQQHLMLMLLLSSEVPVLCSVIGLRCPNAAAEAHASMFEMTRGLTTRDLVLVGIAACRSPIISSCKLGDSSRDLQHFISSQSSAVVLFAFKLHRWERNVQTVYDKL